MADASRPATIDKMFDLAADFLDRLPGRAVRAVINKTDLVTPDLAGFDRRDLPMERKRHEWTTGLISASVDGAVPQID